MLPLRSAASLALRLALAAALPAAAVDAPAPAAPAASPAASSAAPETAKGKALADQDCVKCHGTEVYTRADRKVTSRDGLERQVRRCETALGLRWFEDDIKDVAGYLNSHYYHFK